MTLNSEGKELVLRPDRRGLRMVLGDLEAEIMEMIWSFPEGEWCTVRDVYETMLAERHIAYTTVMNTMSRLAKKGVLESKQQDLAYLYRPCQGRDSFMQRVVGHVLERFLVQFTGPTQAALTSYTGSHPDQHSQVAEMLDEINRRRAQNNGHQPAGEED